MEATVVAKCLKPNYTFYENHVSVLFFKSYWYFFAKLDTKLRKNYLTKSYVRKRAFCFAFLPEITRFLHKNIMSLIFGNSFFCFYHGFDPSIKACFNEIFVKMAIS